MSTRKYRLAAPIDSDAADTPDRPIMLISLPVRPRLAATNNVETNTKRTLLDDKQNIEETVPFIPPARWWLVLPCLILILLPSTSDPLLMNDLIVRRYERFYGLNTSPSTQREVCRESMAPPVRKFYWPYHPYYRELVQRRSDYSMVQRDAARFHLKNSIVTLIPAFISSLVLGSNCDIIGRRPLLVLPIVGKVIRYSLMLIIVSRDLSDAWLLATHAIEVAFGSTGLLLLSAFAYITDCTYESTRTRAFLFTEGLAVIVRIAPALAVGIWLRFYLYTTPLSICLVFSMIALLYALFIQPESVENVRNISLIRQLARIRLKPIARTITVFTVKRSGNKRKQLVLISITFILLQVVLLGYFSVFALYLYGRPLCLDSVHVGLLSSVQATTVFVLCIIAAVCNKSLDGTYLVSVLGSLGIIVNLIIFGLAKRIWLLYLAVCIGSLFFGVLPVLRTKLTRLIKLNENATVFIGAGIIEAIGPSVMGIVAHSIYNASLNFFSGLIFLVFATIGLFPIAIMGYLTYLERKNLGNINSKTVVNDNIQA